MISQTQHSERNEVMRRNFVQQLKQKNMHEFKRKIVDAILKDREKLPGYVPARRGSAMSSKDGRVTQPSTARPADSPSPSQSPITGAIFSVGEAEARKNFKSFISDVVSKNEGHPGAKKDQGIEATTMRANLAIEGARKYKSPFLMSSRDADSSQRQRDGRPSDRKTILTTFL